MHKVNPCVLVFSSFLIFLVRHFQVLQIQRPSINYSQTKVSRYSGQFFQTEASVFTDHFVTWRRLVDREKRKQSVTKYTRRSLLTTDWTIPVHIDTQTTSRPTARWWTPHAVLFALEYA